MVRITNSPDITLAVYHGLKATNQTKLNKTILACLKGSKWGYTELSDFILSVRHSDILSFRHQFSFNILRMNRLNETKFCMHIIIDRSTLGFSKICNFENKWTEFNQYLIRIIIDKIYVGIVNYCFSQSCNRDTTLDSRQDLVFTQYL